MNIFQRVHRFFTESQEEKERRQMRKVFKLITGKEYGVDYYPKLRSIKGGKHHEKRNRK